MIGFNSILESADFDPAQTRLVRHQDKSSRSANTPYRLWAAGDGRFELYQSIQGRRVFRNSNWIASFVANPLNETLFVGVYRVVGVETPPKGIKDPMREQDVSGGFLYDLRNESALQEYAGRVIVEWGSGYRAWVQRADNQDKTILELRRTAIDPPFPGFSAFSWPIRELNSIPSSWRSVLSAVGGVYLLVDQLSGKQYVGSAYGIGGFWARWEEYFRTGHGGNKGMENISDNNYQVSILEFASSSLSRDDVIAIENQWKCKLMTKEFGLNRN